MIKKLAFFPMASLALLAACGGASNDAPETPVAETPVVEARDTLTVSDVEVVHGETRAEHILSWTTEPAGSVDIYASTNPVVPTESAALIADDLTETQFTWVSDDADTRHYFKIVPQAGEPVITAVRLLPLEGGRNFRDLGGYETADGQTVKWGVAFRSGVMNGLTDADYEYLSDLGIKTVCDFREGDERASEPTEWKAGEIEYLTFAEPEGSDNPADNPMFAALLNPESTPEDVALAMAEGYVDIARSEDEGYTAMFDQLAAGKTPLAFNCSAGKDRAGTAAALVLTALGVPRETVVQDYSLSDKYVDYMAEFMSEEARAEAAANPDHPYGFLFQLPEDKVAPLMASDPRYIEATFAALEEEHGSVLAFIQTELDVTDEELASIRANLLQ